MSAIIPAWNSSPVKWAIGPTDLQVWSAALEQPAEVVQRLHGLLAADERARADRFHFDRDRRRFIVARGVLRSILSDYLQLPPERITFEYGAQGKPSLAATHNAPFCFNVAHSHELALYAITLAHEVGIDIEYTLRQVADIDQLADRFFSANENAVYRDLPVSDRRAAFFRCWTRKEAFIKATGEGLSHPLDRFDVTLAPDQPAAILTIDGEPVDASAWSLFHLEPAADYVGAVAVQGSVWRLGGWAP